ncbi:DUF2188 domain-containing protein [Rhodanobacter sp. L36]|uniref:DUF2188 domain-containing protein n=1 Tax=Rhodanobacter sp. L36 TaxID=1747221 RepID=UPI00131CD2C7|nr:DUF2188 domain-containing protein [Rhodanobacter sp. L36]
MKLIEIPFRPDATRGWTVPVPGDGEKRFGSREQALAFAVNLAKVQRTKAVDESYLCVEGADGQWRLFTADLLPVK